MHLIGWVLSLVCTGTFVSGAATAIAQGDLAAMQGETSSLLQEQKTIALDQGALDAEQVKRGKAESDAKKGQEELNAQKGMIEKKALAWKSEAADYQASVKRYGERCGKAFRLPEQQQEYERCQSLKPQLDRQKEKLESEKRRLDSTAEEFQRQQSERKDSERISGLQAEGLKKRRDELDGRRLAWLGRYNALVTREAFRSIVKPGRKDKGCAPIADAEYDTPRRLKIAEDRAAACLQRALKAMSK